jgi:hypothetical protein
MKGSRTYKSWNPSSLLQSSKKYMRGTYVMFGYIQFIDKTKMYSISCRQALEAKIKEEPMIIYATANADPYIPINNLSTAHKHYRTYTNLCSTTKSTLETCCNLSTATDLQHIES